MMSSPAHTPSVLVCRGAVIDASYHDPEIADYGGHPLIEALPPILTEKEAMKRLARYPKYEESDRQLPDHLRLHLVQTVSQIFAPMDIHLDLEQRISRMIRAGYLARNPIALGFWQDAHRRIEAYRPQGSRQNHFLRTTATGFALIGISGVGKTTAIESILSLYPQVISHTRYHERDFLLNQIVWLKLECPFDGSTRGLCLNFFQAVDDLLGTNYYRNYAIGRHPTDELIPYMSRVASLHCLGVLVIDEIQHLSQARSGGSGKMLNFFVHLVNTVGVPVMLIGTYKALSVLSGEFRQTRRSSGQGDLIWDRMNCGATWRYFLECLWRYQYVRKTCELTDGLANTLYDVTQGITDFAVKVFMLAQIRAITTGREAISEAMIRSVAKDNLRLSAPILEALKHNDQRVLHFFEDVHPIDIHARVRGIPSPLHPEEPSSSQRTSAQAAVPPAERDLNQLRNASPKGGSSANPNHPPPGGKVKNRRRLTRDGSAKNVEGRLLQIVLSAEAKHDLAAYEALQQAGYIGSAMEYLPEATS